MTQKRKLNVSGYRGIWGDSLTDEIVTNYTKAFAKFTKEDTQKENPTVLIGRDGRETGPEIAKIIISELEKIGVNVMYGDVLPTPTVLFSVRKHKYDGAIIITASHNPIEYNGLKFVNKNAFFTTPVEVDKINEYCEMEERRGVVLGSIAQAGEPSIAIRQQADMRADENNTSRSSESMPSSDTPNFTKEHADQILAHVNVQTIRERKFKVAVDMINASACVMDPYLFEQLGVELIPLNNIPNGKFAHRPEPLKENLGDIAKLVKDSGADLGFAHDPDADRLLIINEKGEVIREDYTLAFGLENVLSKNPNKTVVINLSTSKMSSDIAEKYGSKCILSKVGEPNVVDEMIKNNAFIGGEGNGGVIYPAVNFVRDSFTSLSLVLELLAECKQTVSECVNSLPKYFMKKDKMPVGKNLEEMYSILKNHFKNAFINEEDGLHLSFTDKSWIHLRPSNTEPIIRLFGEAPSENQIESLFSEVKLTLGLE
jgi:phosphomannomutase